MSGAGEDSGGGRNRSSAFRQVSSAVLSLIAVVLVTLAVLAGITNLRLGLEQYQRASVRGRFELASRFCAISPDTVPEVPPRVLKGNWPLGVPTPEEWARTNVRSDYAHFLNVYFYRTHEVQLLSEMGYRLLGSDARKLVEYIPPKQPRPELWEGEASDFKGGTLEMDAEFAVGDALSEIDLTKKVRELLEAYPNEPFPSSRVRETFVDLSTKGNCEWTLSRIPKSTISDLIEQVFAAARTSSIISDRWTAYEHFDFWQGGYVLTFTNTATVGSNDPPRVSIGFPISSGRHVVEYIIWWTLLAWTTAVLAVGMLTIWLNTRRLWTLGRAAKEGGLIIRSDDNVSKRLQGLADGLRFEKAPVREYKTMLRELSSLLEEREFWLGTLLHQLKNDLQAVILGLGKIQDQPSKTTSTLMDVSKAAGRIRDVLNNVATYQWTVFGAPEPMVVVDLASVLETIVDEIQDAGGQAICRAYSQLYVVAQKDALKSALQNVIWNGHHHGGAIEITVKRTGGGRKAEIVIDDDGPGIREDMVEEMFKPYRQGTKRSDGTNKTFRGAGLGLTIARRVIASHGGEIVVSNRKAKDGRVTGFRVRVVLPVD